MVETMTSCKVCEILSRLPSDEAEEINDYIIDRDVSAEFAATTFSKYADTVGSSTVKKHRKERHDV